MVVIYPGSCGAFNSIVDRLRAVVENLVVVEILSIL